MQNLEEKERKLHQTRSNFRTGNSDLDGKHLQERCSNSVPPVRTDNYRNTVPAPKCLGLPERRSGAFRHHYTTAYGRASSKHHFELTNKTIVISRLQFYSAHAISWNLLMFHLLVLFSFYFIQLFVSHPHLLLNIVGLLSAFWQSLIKYMMMMMMTVVFNAV